MSRKRPSSTKAIKPNATVVTPTRDSFVNAQAKLGYGAGSISDGGTYTVDFVSRNRQQLDSMYRSSWICGKAVDVIGEDMTKRGIDIQSEIDPQETEALLKSWKSLKVWDRLCDAIKWGRLYGGSIAVLMIDGQNLSTPLRIDTIKKDQFKGIAVLDRWQVTPTLEDLVQDIGPEHGLPKYYNVVADSFSLPKQKIHYSRVIRFEGQELPYWQRITEQLWGQSVLERLFDRLLAFDSTTLGAAQLIHKAHLRTYSVENLRETIATGGKALDGLTKQIEFIRQTQTNEGLTLMDAKDKFEAHSYSFGGLDLVLLQFGQQLSGALNIPLTRLFGQSPAGLSSTGESDMATYYDGIEQEQERRMRSGVSLLLQVSYASKFGKPWPDTADFSFRPLWQITDTEKATIATGVTSTVSTAFQSQLIGRKTALKELRQSSRLTGVWSNITDEAIEAADDDVQSDEELGLGSAFGDEDESDAGTKKSAGTGTKAKSKAASSADAASALKDLVEVPAPSPVTSPRAA